MEAKDLNQLLLNSIPEITNKFNNETSWQEGIDTGCIVVFEDVFMPFLEAAVDVNDIFMIDKIYSFIEKMCNIDDEYVQNVLYVAILENIHDFVNPEPYTKYLKEKSLKKYNENFQL